MVLFMLWCVALQAQRNVQTIVPLQPITVGSAFQVQYIITDAEPVVELQSPAFGKDFRFVSGPRLYQGEALINNSKIPIQNFSYTLIPLRKGRLIVKGATAVFKSGKVKSDDTFVVVADAAKEDPLASTPISDLPRLAPGSTWNAKLQEQIFIKTAVSKQSCFVGEPVVATFTLFSRLPSASEVLKNPGFYGFSVLDMPDAADGGQTVQTFNGAFYNTHILRKVQLYPMQAGHLLLDKMSVSNAIEYADSASGATVQTTVMLDSRPTTITVKPLPDTTPETFAGGVGSFSITADLEKGEWPQNSNGKLMVTITGTGNFLQLSAPEIQWPKGVDVFEPAATERLRKEAVPVSGTRTYTYTVTADSTGDYVIPPIAFTYFNVADKKYKTALTDSLHFTILKDKSSRTLPFSIGQKLPPSHVYLWLLAAVGMALAGGLLFIRYRHRKPLATEPRAEEKTQDSEQRITTISANDPDAYRQLQQALMDFLKSLPMPAAQPGSIQQVEAGLPTDQKKDLHAILEECEAVQYYKAVPSISFIDLQQQALHFIRSVKRFQARAPERK